MFGIWYFFCVSLRKEMDVKRRCQWISVTRTLNLGAMAERKVQDCKSQNFQKTSRCIPLLMCVDHISRDAQYVFHMCFFDADLDMFMLPRHLFDFWEAHCNPQKTNTCRQKKTCFPALGPLSTQTGQLLKLWWLVRACFSSGIQWFVFCICHMYGGRFITPLKRHREGRSFPENDDFQGIFYQGC